MRCGESSGEEIGWFLDWVLGVVERTGELEKALCAGLRERYGERRKCCIGFVEI